MSEASPPDPATARPADVGRLMMPEKAEKAPCDCPDPWAAHPEGFIWAQPGGPPWWHTTWEA